MLPLPVAAKPWAQCLLCATRSHPYSIPYKQSPGVTGWGPGSSAQRRKPLTPTCASGALSLLPVSALLCILQGPTERQQEGRDPFLDVLVYYCPPPLPRMFSWLSGQEKTEFESAPSLPGWLGLSIHLTLHTCPGLYSAEPFLPLHTLSLGSLLAHIPSPPTCSLNYLQNPPQPGGL